MNELEYPNYKSSLDDGIQNVSFVISIGEARSADYYTKEQEQDAYNEFRLYKKCIKKNI